MIPRLEPVTLEELDATAALQTRVDRKYALDRVDAAEALTRIPASTRLLELEGTTWFGYESVYFDTPELTSYRMAAHARRRRFKLRTRAYLDTATAYLEVKTRGARSTTVKERLPYGIGDRERLTGDGIGYAEAVLGPLRVDPALLAPTLVTRYRRATLLLDDGSRATVDTRLEWEDECGVVLARPGLVIVESKSAGAASALDRMLWRAGHRPVTISKYGTGLAALRPDLPANKWTRVLRRHFDAA